MKKILLILTLSLLFGLLCKTEPLASSSASPLPAPENLKYPALKFQLPHSERKELNNGISLHIAEDHELPLVKITALIKAGITHDPPGKEGLADLVGKVLLTGGTRMMAGDEVDETLAFMAAEIRCDVSLEHTLLTLSVLQKDLDRALEIFSRILREPQFEAGKFQVARNLKIEELRRLADEPQDLAFRTYRKLLYKGNPRGRLSTLASLNQIDRLDLMTFHKTHFFPKNILLAVSGDISVNEALLKLNRTLGDWQEENRGRSPLAPPVPGQTVSLSLLSKDTPQSIIIYGHLGPGIMSPDFYPFTVLDFILGSGGFQSRIFQEIRTNRGLAYSAGSFYQGRRDYGVFESYAFTKAGETTQVLKLIKELVRQIQEKEISPKEMKWAKNAITNNFIFTFKSADDVAFQEMMLEYKELSRDFLEAYPGNIANVKAEDVKRVALKYLDAQRAVILVLGPEKEFETPLSQFGPVIREDIF